MAIDGTWDTSVSTPMGAQKGTLVLKTDGNALSGSSTTSFGTSNFTGGKVDGNNIEFTVESSTPFGPAKFEFKCKVDGDNMTGETTMQPMGMKSSLTGTRVK
ncbi:MAG TPA: hypothetical protein VJ488_01740 [Dehalococcoidia bacterium]|nr:hypothetical protein [Dehalococcoidia bacterium]